MGNFDVTIVGGGIIGLAHAYHARIGGLSVRLVERSALPLGGSVRNFGMVWPIGRVAGADLDRAMRAREHWLTISKDAGFWLEACGSVHIARTEAEQAVLEEFAAGGGSSRDIELMSPDETVGRFPLIRREGLHGGLFSSSECAVYPLDAIRAFASWLDDSMGVDMSFGTPAVAVRDGSLVLADGEIVESDRIIVASGPDLATLYPEHFAGLPIQPCQLQMMRSAPLSDDQPRLGAHLAAGLTLMHYPSFADCPSLDRIREYYEQREPAFAANGIHVLAAQNAQGHLTIGDSHEYTDEPSHFRDERIDTLILDYLHEMIDARFEIESRWLGIYAKRMDGGLFFHDRVEPGVEIVNGFGGMGMTLGLAVAEEVIACEGDATADPFVGVPTAAA